MYIHNLFIHSSINGHLGCFHILDIVNSDTMNTDVHITFCSSVFFFLFVLFSGKYKDVKLLDHMGFLGSSVAWEPKNVKFVTVFIFSPSTCYQLMGPNAMIFVF